MTTAAEVNNLPDQNRKNGEQYKRNNQQPPEENSEGVESRVKMASQRLRRYLLLLYINE